jgi:hypothetical protein
MARLVREVQAASAAVLCLVGLVGLQFLGTGPSRSVLGQDADWDMHKWSPEHAIDVKASRVDGTSVHNIWHSKKEAWSGIDRILPTGGRFGYEEYHNINGNEAKLLNFIKHAKNEIKTIENHLPSRGHERDWGKAQEQTKLTLDGELNGLYEIKRETEGETSVVDRDKSSPQMLAQQKPLQRAKRVKRVFADNALYGEGILGDIRSDGHHLRKWSAKGAESDMDKYFKSLNKKIHTKEQGWTHRQGDEFDEYMGDLAARNAAKAREHGNILKQEHYYSTHPAEKMQRGAH